MKFIAGIGVAVVLGLGVWVVLSETQHTHDEDHQEAQTVRSDAFEPREPVRADGTFTIATSFYPLQFALERIVGDRGEVINIGAGRDPHDFRPSTQDILAVQQADAVVLQGAMLEPWGEEVAAQLRADEIPVVIATDAIALHEIGHEHEAADEVHHDAHTHHDEATSGGATQLDTIAHADEDEHAHEKAAVHHESEEHHEGEHHDEHDAEAEDHGHDEHDHGDYDPHTWLDPVLFSEQVAYLTEVMSTLDPEFAAEYEANGAALQTDLATLATQFSDQLTNCRYDEVIVSHDFLGYVGDRYALGFHSISGISTQDRPSATTLAALREKAAAGAGAILLEENAVSAYGDTLARETGLPTIAINPVAFSIPAGENYLTLQADNALALAAAFSCNE